MLPTDDGVLVIVPVLNEEKHLDACIRALLAQVFDRPFRILILDGGSTDRTRELANALCAEHANVHLLMNPRRIQSAAVNIAAASDFPGKILVRADAHADYRNDYVARCVEALETTGADSVVVSMRTVGLVPFQRAVAAAQNSLLGNGASAHRRATSSRFVDHGHHAAFRRDFFLAIGGYDENFTHNEDAEFDRRAVLAGGRIWLCAEATITYYPRSRIKDLSRQYYNYGRGRAQNMLRHRTMPKLRQLAPLAVTLGAALGLVAAPLFPPAALVPLLLILLYAGWSLVVSVQRRDPAILAMGVAAAAMHVSWSAGFLAMATKATLRNSGS